MSTAGRPTWNAAKGANRYFAPSAAVSGKDQRGHTKLKTRQTGQNSANEVKQRNLKAELAAREKKYKASKEHRDVMEEDEEEEEEEQLKIENREARKREKEQKEKNIDADDSDESSGNSSEEESGKEEEEDDTAELMKELEKIRKEREEDEARKKMAEIQEEVKEREEQVRSGNPLLSVQAAPQPHDATLKKRWYEDTIFKNQARGEVKQQKRFINDTIRNDFHKKFLQRYIK